MDDSEEGGSSPESQALVLHPTMERRAARRTAFKRPNYRRRVRTRATPAVRMAFVFIAGGALLLASFVIIPGMEESLGWDLGGGGAAAGDRRRLSSGSSCVQLAFEKAVSDPVAFIVYFFGLSLLFIGLAIVTDDYFVPALVVISAKLELSEDVAGATFMAAGSSAPELFTSLADTLFTEESNIGIGTIVGSAVFNILVIIACAGAFAPEVLFIDWRPMTRDISFYCGSILALFIFTYWDDSCGVVTPAEGFGMFAMYFLYVGFMVFNESFMDLCNDPTTAATASGDQAQQDSQDKNDRDADANLGPPPTARPQGSVSLGGIGFGKSRGDEEAADDGDAEEEEEGGCLDSVINMMSVPWNVAFELTIPDVNSEELKEDLDEAMAQYEANDDPSLQEQLSKRSETARRELEKKEQGYTVAFTISILWIGTIAALMVLLAERCGCIIGIPAPIMGVTVLAAGTSIPDALGSIIAAKSRQGDMAVANAIGSNVFDILIGLGLPYGIYGVTESAADAYGGYVVELNGIIAQMVILFLTVLATFALFMFFKWRLTNGLGYSMLVIYAAFCVYSVITAKNPRWYSDKKTICTPPCLKTNIKDILKCKRGGFGLTKTKY